MRYVVGLVLVLVVVASPALSRAQENQVAPPSWVESELATVVSAQQQGAGLSVDRLQIALIPEHLKQRQPGYTKPPPETKSSDPSSETQQKRLSKGGKIAIAVVVPVVLAGVIGVAVWAATFDLGW